MNELEETYLDAQLQVTFEEQVKRLAELRRKEADAKEMLDLMRKSLEESKEWMRYRQILETAQHEQRMLDDQIRSLAVTNYEGSGEKHPHPAVSIRLYTKVKYDYSTAFVWSQANLPQAITLDTKLFDKHAKAVAETAPIYFVEIAKEPQASIASDLSAYLPD